MRRTARASPGSLSAVSEPVGVVNLAELWNGSALDHHAYTRMRGELIMRFRPARTMMDLIAPFDAKTHHLLGTSGTVTTLAGLALGLPRYNRAKVDGSWHDCRDIAAVIDRLTEADIETRAAMGVSGAIAPT